MFKLIPFLKKKYQILFIPLWVKIVLSFVFSFSVGFAIFIPLTLDNVDNTINNLILNRIKTDINNSEIIYEKSLNEIFLIFNLISENKFIKDSIRLNKYNEIKKELIRLKNRYDLDFIGLTDNQGKVLVRTLYPFNYGDDKSNDPLIADALRKNGVCSTEIMTPHELQLEGNHLEQKVITVLDSDSEPLEDKDKSSMGMVLKAAVPIFDKQGTVLGIIYGGNLVNHNYYLVDTLVEKIYDKRSDGNIPSNFSSIFLWDTRITTNLVKSNGLRATGFKIHPAVYRSVLENGKDWIGRLIFMGQNYVSAFKPIRNLRGEVIGVLNLNILEEPLGIPKKRLISQFIWIGFISISLAFILLYFLARDIAKPISALSWAINRVSEKGQFEGEIPIKTRDEVGQLVESFNRMSHKLQKARIKLKEWGETLEKKVSERTKKINEMQDQLIESERMAILGSLLAHVTHEISTPLTSVTLNAELLFEELEKFEGKDTKEAENLIKIIIAELDRLTKITENYLTFAKPPQPKLENKNINQVISSLLTLMRKEFLTNNIRVKTDFDVYLPPVKLDEDLIREAFLNIIKNSLDAMPDGGEILLSTSSRDSFVQVNINDSGKGIDHENIDKIFTPFFSEKKGGTGLGLPIARYIIKKHGGAIICLSKTGEGTTFVISFPIH
ncbi:MAG: cache domain-containing protein [Thermodesulfobacteriota bacterium]|nr:cache domain-containing protein [Thermodesulfobacteriota bacterium]